MIVYTGGTFDLFHAGHVQFLRRASQYGEVVVALNTDEFIKQFKGKPPVMSYSERYEIVSACRFVKYVVPNLSGADSRPTILSVMPNFIVIGDDWLKKDYYKQMGFSEAWLRVHNIKLIYVPYTKDVSTTAIKERIKNDR